RASMSGRRDQLLKIAARLFATKGYSSTTVRDIADEAGMLSGSLYHHFASKEAMLDEVLRGFLDGLYSRFEDIVSDGLAPREALDALIELSFATIHENPHAVTLYQNEATYISQLPGFEYVHQAGSKIESLWTETIAAGQSAGVISAELDPRIAYRFLRSEVLSLVGLFR